jgi:acyl-CoA reductase-like NAD-dependent aldehyde dehydrogenase
VVEPATGDVVGAVGRATPEDVAAAADRAAEAQRAWAALPFEDRARVLRRAGEVLEASADEIKGWLARETGDPFSSLDQVVELARGTEYGLSLRILTRDVYAGLQLAERIPSGLVHINDQTVNDEAVAPFGGVGASGTSSRHGGPQANIEAFTETQWVTLRGDLPAYPF